MEGTANWIEQQMRTHRDQNEQSVFALPWLLTA